MAYKKGESGNPKGRPPLSEKQRVVSKLTKETFAELCEKMMTCTREEIEDLLAATMPYEAELFIRHMLALGENPDWNQYNRYLDRRIGKVVEQVEMIVPKPTIIQLSGERQIVLGAEMPREDDE